MGKDRIQIDVLVIGAGKTWFCSSFAAGWQG